MFFLFILSKGDILNNSVNENQFKIMNVRHIQKSMST